MEKYILTLKSAGLHSIKKVRYAGDLTSVRLSEEYSVQDYCNTRMKENGDEPSKASDVKQQAALLQALLKLTASNSVQQKSSGT